MLRGTEMKENACHALGVIVDWVPLVPDALTGDVTPKVPDAGFVCPMMRCAVKAPAPWSPRSEVRGAGNLARLG